MALGLDATSLAALKMIGQTEQVHVTTLLSAISAQNIAPVQPCEYNFGFTNAAGMVATARVLEAVGISAYLGAAPLVNSSAILSVAASIATVEARHQTFIRGASKALPVPSAFDTPVGVRAVFTLAAAFIKSCPQGSNLNVQAFPAIAVQNSAAVAMGENLVLQNPGQPAGATFCAFTNGGLPGGTAFVPIVNGACAVPMNLAGEVFMTITSSGTALTDDVILAGPSVLEIS
jgi:hypothetical protein